MSETDPETLAAIVAMVNAGTDDGEVAAYAVVIAPRMWIDARNGAPLLAVVRGAIAKARRTVALAGWDMYGDMTDAMALADDGARTSLSHYGTAPADAQWGVTYGDAVATAVGTLAGEGDRVTLAGAASAYVRARRSYDGTGRPVALAGALAMASGWGATDARYHASRRMTLAACKRVDRVRVLALTGVIGARPTYGTNRVSVGNGFPSHDVPASVIAGRAGRAVPGVTLTRSESVTTGVVWSGRMSGAGHVRVWDGRAVVDVDVRTARRNGWPVVDVLGYDAPGYAPVARVPAGGWVATREVRVSVRALPPVTVGARRPMLPPDMIVTPAGARLMTEAEAEAVSAPSAGRAPLTEADGADDAQRAPGGWEVFGHRSPSSVPSGRSVTPGDAVRSGKVEPSPRKRSGGSTGPTVPARLTR